jgi:ribosomal protein S18 acetylase RimI-like enzyme
VTDAADFTLDPDDPYTADITALFEQGSSDPSICFVLEDEGARIGRVGFRTSPTTSDPSWLGSLPPIELFTFGFDLPLDDPTLCRTFVEGAVASLPASLPDLVEVRLNAEVHDTPQEKIAVLTGMGFELFHEKQGYWWEHDGTAIHRPPDLEWAALGEVGRERYAAVMAPCGEGTLDRNDRFYWEGCGADNWAQQMLELHDPEMWLLGLDDGEPVGYVAVNADDDWGATISHIGVVPGHRGNGHVHRLLQAAMALCLERDITTMLSDVDVLNTPMRAAFLRAGHRDDARPWHVWVLRRGRMANGE